jgi:hypothetical protein
VEPEAGKVRRDGIRAVTMRRKLSKPPIPR